MDPQLRRTSSTYDAAGRLTEQELHNDVRFTYTYDDAGRRTLMADNSGRYTTTYDGRGMVQAVTGPPDKQIQYGGWPCSSNVVSERVPLLACKQCWARRSIPPRETV